MKLRSITEKESKKKKWLWRIIFILVMSMWAIYELFDPIWEIFMKIVTGSYELIS